MRVYKLYANCNASGTNLGSVVIARTGRIKRIRWRSHMDSVVDNESAIIELSLHPTSVALTNDTSGTIDEAHLVNNGTSGGANAVAINSDVDVPVGLGERLYLNATVVGTPTNVKTSCFVDVEE